jgi:hypothetical protein
MFMITDTSSDCCINSLGNSVLNFGPVFAENASTIVKKKLGLFLKAPLKGIVQPFELGGETRLIRSAVK